MADPKDNPGYTFTPQVFSTPSTPVAFTLDAESQKTFLARHGVAIGIIVVILLGVIAVSVWAALSNQDNSDTKDEKADTTTTNKTQTTNPAPAETKTTTETKTPAETPKPTPLPRITTVGDCGYIDKPRGWMDLDGLGVSNAYCRFVGGSATEPEWWSCAKPGASTQYTEKGAFKYDDHKSKLVPYKGEIEKCPVRPTQVGDCGYLNKQRGWMDLDNDGQFTDYCRYVGGSATEPDWWSCAIPKATTQYTAKGVIAVPDATNDKIFKPYKAKDLNCDSRRDDIKDCGYSDKPRGWMDLLGDGQFLDYCRYVGDKAAAFWSCTKRDEASDKKSDKGVYDYDKHKEKLKALKSNELTACPTV